MDVVDELQKMGCVFGMDLGASIVRSEPQTKISEVRHDIFLGGILVELQPHQRFQSIHKGE